MLDDLILSIGSIIFTTILMIVYYSKQRFMSIQNKLYRALLAMTYILLFTEIITNMFYDFSNALTLNTTILRIHWATRIIWFALLYFSDVGNTAIPSINPNSMFTVPERQPDYPPAKGPLPDLFRPDPDRLSVNPLHAPETAVFESPEDPGAFS